MQTDIDPRSLIGRKAFDRDGAKIGTVDEVYLDDATGEPEWAAVRTGLFGRDAFVPLEPSRIEGDSLHIPYERALIKEAPDFGVGRHLSPEQELQLYHHYGLELPPPEGSEASEAPEAPGAPAARGPSASAPPAGSEGPGEGGEGSAAGSGG
ncbi:sporulation protein YlmC with PRC-barrel domain [Streptomyces olivoverticillatus]|uniref:Sporulation protein YlmC with PRC-barrel domain n=1 Tax=Streptomyces olivoverticillatus TaxID=66427 RepID=A0A7W7LQ90_9ACTN|nr:sporulation protein YlmC with PRC-barrel domain [Streptomyces olivoverticillatus]